MATAHSCASPAAAHGPHVSTAVSPFLLLLLLPREAVDLDAMPQSHPQALVDVAEEARDDPVARDPRQVRNR